MINESNTTVVLRKNWTGWQIFLGAYQNCASFLPSILFDFNYVRFHVKSEKDRKEIIISGPPAAAVAAAAAAALSRCFP